MPQEFTDDETDSEQWEREVKDLNNDRRIFEPWCGDCMRKLSADETIPGAHFVHFGCEDGVCDCKEPSYIFVGESTAAPLAWDAAGVLLELVQRAAIIIKRQGDELDHEAARSVRDEELLGELRLQLDDLRAQHEKFGEAVKALEVEAQKALALPKETLFGPGIMSSALMFQQQCKQFNQLLGLEPRDPPQEAKDESEYGDE